MMHKHNWKDVSYDYIWTYQYIRCNSGSRWVGWTESRKYQKENPGHRTLGECKIHDYDDHSQYADPQTIIHQKCDCGDYREQYVDGILELKDDIECKEESKIEVGDKLKK